MQIGGERMKDLRAEFEKLFPVPEGIHWADKYSRYVRDIYAMYEVYEDIYQARWEGFLARKPDPWDWAPDGQINSLDTKRHLQALEIAGNLFWQITTELNGVRRTVASGYDCNPSRNGETRVWNEDKEVWG
jgi:hypothetical protein